MPCETYRNIYYHYFSVNLKLIKKAQNSNKSSLEKCQTTKSVGRGYIHGCRVGTHISKWLFTRQPFKSQIRYIHGCRVSAYNRYLHGSRSSAKSAMYTAAVCPHKILIYTAADQEQNLLYTLLPGVYIHGIAHIPCLCTRQQFKSQTEFSHDSLYQSQINYMQGPRAVTAVFLASLIFEKRF